MGQSSDVIVVGGGIVGTAIACRLARDGSRVVVLERGEIGRESSFAAGGMLTPVHLADYPPALVGACEASLARYAPLCTELAAETSIDPEYRTTGLLLLVSDEASEEDARRLEQWKLERRQPYRRLGRTEALELEPNLNPSIRGALHLPDIAQVRNNRMAAALAELAAKRGAEIRRNSPVTGFLKVPGRVTGVKTPRGDLYAGTTIVATGAWSPALLEPLGIHLASKPIKGQILLVQGAADTCRSMVLEGESYLIPRADGRILVGSTLEDVGFDKSVTLEATGDLSRRGIRLMPALAKLPVVTSWSGLRPSSPDRLPYLGRVGGVDGLILATGHFRNGILLAPLTGELVADLVAGRTPSIDLAPFDPLRRVEETAGAG
jgi:glycine oxidase